MLISKNRARPYPSSYNFESTQDLTETLDFKGLKCPLPVLRTQKALRNFRIGAEVTVLATDPASTIDMAHFCATSGNELMSSTRDGDTFVFRIKKTNTTA